MTLRLITIAIAKPMIMAASDRPSGRRVNVVG